MLIDNLTNVAQNSSVSKFVQVLDNILGGWFIFGILLGFLVVFIASLFSWSRDFIQSVTFGSFLVTTISFLIFIIKVDGVRLLSFEQFSFFMVITGLSLFIKKMND